MRHMDARSLTKETTMETKFNVTRDAGYPEWMTVAEMKAKAESFYERHMALETKIKRYKKITEKLMKLEEESAYCLNEFRFYNAWATMHAKRAA